MTIFNLVARLEAVGRRLPATVLRVGTEAALDAEAAAKLNATGFPRVRSGRLRSSISGTARADGESVVVSVQAGGAGQRGPVPYGRVQEEGPTIRPVNGRFLAIPVGPAKTAAGVARYASPRDVPNLRFQPIRGGAMGRLVRDVGGRNARAETWFLLVRQVKIRPKYYLRRAVDAVTPTVLGRLTDALITQIIGGA